MTLEPLEQLQQDVVAIRRAAGAIDVEVSGLRDQMMEIQARAGAILVQRRREWDSAPLATLIDQAAAEWRQVYEDDRKVAELEGRPHRGLAGLFRHLADEMEKHRLRGERERLSWDLRRRLSQIAQQAPAVTVPEADSLRAQISALQERIGERLWAAEALRDRAATLEEEAERRQRSVAKLGFDAPYTAARFQTQGPPSVESPVVLHPGEVARATLAATLARQRTRTTYVGGSSGFSVPIGHTGIRYRVGSFRGHAVQTQYLDELGEGTLVLTNQRLVFLGHAVSVTLPLRKIVHVEQYRDGLSIFSESHQNPDFYLCRQPDYFLFCLNWVLAHEAAL